jgi:hypothetical protein
MQTNFRICGSCVVNANLAVEGELRDKAARPPTSTINSLFMKLSAGFCVVLIVALLLVVGPFSLLMIKFWRSGTLGKTGFGLSILAVVALAISFFVDEPLAGSDSFEENLVLFLGAWGFSFYSIVGLSSIVNFARRALTKSPPNSAVSRDATKRSLP